MAKSITVSARVEPALKQEVDSILKSIGLTATEAINLFYKMVKQKKGLPFEEKIPNKETLQVFKDTDAGKNLNYCDSYEQMFDELGI